MGDLISRHHFISTGCGGEFTGATGSLTSPNYPLSYGHNAECFWNVTVAAGSRVRLKVVDLNLETSSSCTYDYLEVSDLIAMVTNS